MPWCLPSYPSIYKPLQEIRQELRLLTLYPIPLGKEDAIIECTLSTHSLLPPHPEKFSTTFPFYDALSYEWGASTSNRREIRFQGEPFLIRENLWLALHSLRCTKEKRILWIDALCINQQDNSERGNQVQLMGIIYSRARMVHVWLGPDNWNVSEAFDLLEIIWQASGKRKYTQLEEVVCSRQLELGIEKKPISSDASGNVKYGNEKEIATIHARIEERRSTRWYDIDLMRLLMEEYSNTTDWDWKAWHAIAELLQLSYWRRIWIVQEFVLAKWVRIHCGDHSIDWEVFDGAISHILRFKVDRFPETHFVQEKFWFIMRSAGSRVWEMRSRGKGTKTLLELLESCKASQCSDMRDKVYALLGLAKDVSVGAIEIDYTKPSLMLITDVVQYHRRQKQNAELSYITSLLLEMFELVS